MNVLKNKLKSWMKYHLKNVEDFDHYDPKTGEVNLTRLAENAAHHGPGEDWMLDVSDHVIWEAAVEVYDDQSNN